MRKEKTSNRNDNDKDDGRKSRNNVFKNEQNDSPTPGAPSMPVAEASRQKLQFRQTKGWFRISVSFVLSSPFFFFAEASQWKKARNGHGFSQKMERNGAAPRIAHKNCRCCRLESKIYRLIALTLIECTRRHKERAARVVEMVENKLIFPPPTLSHSLRGTLRMFYCAFRTTNEAVVINF